MRKKPSKRLSPKFSLSYSANSISQALDALERLTVSKRPSGIHLSNIFLAVKTGFLQLFSIDKFSYNSHNFYPISFVNRIQLVREKDRIIGICFTSVVD